MSDELDDGARDFIQRALREERSGSPAALAQIRRRVLASALAVSSVGGAAHAAAGKGLLTIISAPLLKTLVVGSLAVGGAATLAVSLPSETSRSAPARVAPSEARAARTVPLATTLPTERAVVPPLPSALETAVAAPSAAAPPLSEPVPPAAPTPSLTVPAPSHAGAAIAAPAAATTAVLEKRRPALSEELAVLREARARLNAGDGKGALRLLDETSLAHAGGQLGVERAVVEIQAACKAGEVQRADRLARAFLAAHPNAPAAASVRGSCAGEGR